MPSDFQQFLAMLEHLDYGDLLQKLSTLLTRLDTSLTQLNMAQINAGVTNLLSAAHDLIATPDLTNSIFGVKRALDNMAALLTRINGRIDPIADNLTNTLYEAQKTIIELRPGVQNLSGLLEPDSSFHSEITEKLEQLGEAGRSLADLAEFLKRNPNALLTGRKQVRREP